jgi:hypothetical protein
MVRDSRSGPPAFSPVFDWYQASVLAQVDQLRGALRGLVGCGGWHPSPVSLRGYASEEVLEDADGLVARLAWGGMHDRPHVVIVGERAPAGVNLLRTEFPCHSVSRVDVYVDYVGHDAYDYLERLTVQLAAECRVQLSTAGDHLLTKKGRTVYLGAATSATRVRLYDKATELRKKFGPTSPRLVDLPIGLTRLELQVRPQTMPAK